MPRQPERDSTELRPITIQRQFIQTADGSVLISAGKTVVLCTASVAEGVPSWKSELNPTGWVTAEYSMLPGSTSPRKPRRTDGRATEIQRLIGRSLRAVVNFAALGERTVTVDCDVLQADGGTRTLSITGAFVAMVDAFNTLKSAGLNPAAVLTDSVAAVSVGVVGEEVLLDLDYSEDSRAAVDLNVVMTGSGKYIELQGTAEAGPFDRDQLDRQLAAAESGIAELTRQQRVALDEEWPFVE